MRAIFEVGRILAHVHDHLVTIGCTVRDRLGIHIGLGDLGQRIGTPGPYRRPRLRLFRRFRGRRTLWVNISLVSFRGWRSLWVSSENQLWLRIFPDDIHVETHEEILTQDEVDAAQIYWTEIWRAGGDANR